MQQHSFLGLGLSVVLSATGLAACSSDTKSTGGNPDASASAGGSSAGGAGGRGTGGSATGGKGGSATGGKGGTVSTGGKTGTGGASADGSTPGTGGTDAGTPADGAAPAQCGTPVDAGSQCNTLVNTGSDVTLMAATGTLPVGVGGILVDGIYHLTKMAYYPGSSMAGAVLTQKATWLACGGPIQYVAFHSVKGEIRKSGTLSFVGIVPTLNWTCDTDTAANVPYTSYTANSRTLAFYSASLGFEAVLTRQ
jgi:hypothetical protein